jgi:transcriptional repressor NrdR
MRCPRCGTLRDKVVDSRSSQGGAAIRRRRECLECGERFTTYEYVESFSLVVIKRDGAREPYDRAKLQAGIMTACKKRPISTGQIDDQVAYVRFASVYRDFKTAEEFREELDRLSGNEP